MLKIDYLFLTWGLMKAMACSSALELSKNAACMLTWGANEDESSHFSWATGENQGSSPPSLYLYENIYWQKKLIRRYFISQFICKYTKIIQDSDSRLIFFCKKVVYLAQNMYLCAEKYDCHLYLLTFINHVLQYHKISIYPKEKN